MDTVEHVAMALHQAQEQRRLGESDARVFYGHLLSLVGRLIPLLLAELEDADTVMADNEIKKQIPLILFFLEDQIKHFRNRAVV